MKKLFLILITASIQVLGFSQSPIDPNDDSGNTSASNPVIKVHQQAALNKNGPVLVENGNNARIVWQGDNIVELLGYKLLRIRSSGFNSRWIGAGVGRMNLCWSYSDVNDYVLVGKTFKSTEDGFVLEIEAEKPSVRGRVISRLEGKLLSPELGFKYTLSSRLTAAQKEWRAVSKNVRNKKPEDALGVEMLDYHIDHISLSDNFSPGGIPGADELYNGFVISHDGKDWQYIPKTPVYPVRKGNYPTLNWNIERQGLPGFRIGIVDSREGGWISELVDASAPLRIEVCWMFFDLHNNLVDAIPPWTAGNDNFEAHYTLAFTPIHPELARDLLGKAKPMEWLTLPEYQLPLFSRYSTFDRLISKSCEYPWLATSYDCAIDKTTGYDDKGSICIKHDDPKKFSAWYAWTWGPCFDDLAALDGVYRFSVMVKTKDCTSPFRLAVAEFFHDMTTGRDGKLDSPKGKMWDQIADKNVLWYYSDRSVTGTTGWTRLTIDLRIDNEHFKPVRAEYIRRGVVLQYEGKGTIWFDNVRIMKVE